MFNIEGQESLDVHIEDLTNDLWWKCSKLIRSWFFLDQIENSCQWPCASL
jgi:hypothetical protein